MSVTACMGADVVHELVGHGVASWLTGDPLLSLSTVATQNEFPSRIVSAAGTGANVLGGIGSLVLLRRFVHFNSLALFLWAFGAFNLFNVGYLTASAVAGGGDWSNVVFGLVPEAFWRTLLGCVGVVSYLIVFRWLASFLAAFVNGGELAAAGVRRLAWTAYLAGGVVLTAGSTLNPIGASLILISGLGASFGLNAGLVFLPGYVAGRAEGREGSPSRIGFSAVWLGIAVVTAILFVGVLGPGIQVAG